MYEYYEKKVVIDRSVLLNHVEGLFRTLYLKGVVPFIFLKAEKNADLLLNPTSYPIASTLYSCLVESNLQASTCLLYTSPSPRDRTRSRMPSSA